MKGLKILFLGLRNIITSINRDLELPNKLLFITGLIIILFSMISTAITNIFIAIYVVIWCIEKANNKIKYPQLDLLFIFSIIAVVCTASLSYISTQPDYIKNLSSLKPYLRLLLIPALIPAFITNKQKELAIYVFITSSFINLIVIYLKISGLISIYTFEAGTSQAFKDSIYTSLAFSLSIFFCLTLASHKSQHHYLKTFLFLMAGVFFHYLYFIGVGRTGQILGIFLIFGYCAHQIYCGKIRYIFMILFLALTLLITNNSFTKRIGASISEAQIYQSKADSDLADQDSSFGLRSEWAINSIRLYLKKPITGFGVGNFEESYRKYFPARFDKYGEAVDNPHNQYLLISVELGALGLILMAIMLFATIRPGISVGCDKGQRSMLLATTASLIIGSIANSWLKDHTSSIIFITLIAALSIPNKLYKGSIK